MSEVGLTIETWKTEGDDIIFDPEVTPNRPDWMSVTGIAREVAAATNSRFQIPDARFQIPKPKNKLEINYKTDLKLCPRTSTVIIRNVRVKSSPEWLQKRIKQIGLRPINNLVDITNYVLWLYGNPLHVFDYDRIRGHTMTVERSSGGEEFRSLDGINYRLPKDAIIIKDVGRVIDLPPLKGGENTAVGSETKNILLHSIVCDPISTRRVSQALGLRSDSSTISERGVDPNGTTQAALKALELILELAGGEMASPLMETPQKPYPSWTVEVSHEKIEKVLGIKIDSKKVMAILESLELKTAMDTVTVPTFRNDLHIEEDIIEEIGRIIGYNSFPKTLPPSAVPTAKVAYAHSYDFDFSVKQILKGTGYSEIYTYSLISEDQLIKLGTDPGKVLRVDNPISKEYEYLRPDLFGNLLNALKLNQANFSDIKLFELGKEYKGSSCDKVREEYWLWGIVSGERFLETKGDLTLLLNHLGINFTVRPSTKVDDIEYAHPGRSATIETSPGEYLGFVSEIHPAILARWGIKNRAITWELKQEILEKSSNLTKKYQPIPKYPPIIEDISLLLPNRVLVGDIIQQIQAHKLISRAELLDSHENSKTFRIYYQDPQKNLTDKEVAEIKSKILAGLKEKFKVTPKK